MSPFRTKSKLPYHLLEKGNSPSSVFLSCGASLSVVTPVGLRGASGTEADGAPAEQ